MRRHYHPTDLQFASRHCGYALTLREQGVPYDRRPFETGIAAHACLEHIARVGRKDGATLTDLGAAVVTRDVCERLISHGREWDGKPEPPLTPDAVWAGRKLALDWHAFEPVSHLADVEVPLSYKALACIADYMERIEYADEEGACNRLIVRDYKSAWSTDAGELDTIQRKAQAVCATGSAIADDVEALQLEVVNLRTRQKFVREVWLDATGREEIAGWYAEIEATIRALEAAKDDNGDRPAVAGVHCTGCPFVMRCEAAVAFAEACDADTSPSCLAMQYVALTEKREFIARLLKHATDEEAVEVPGGVVGYQAQPRRILTRGGEIALVDEWSAGRGDLAGFVAAADLTVSNAEAIAKVLYPAKADKQDREAFIEQITDTAYVRRFGIHKSA